MLQLWRTLLLSCFTASRPTSPSRFTTFTGATLFPYITYVHHLDVRTLVMVLSGIRDARVEKDTCDPSALGPDSGARFFAGALGAFEIVGEIRGERMIVDGPEYRVRSPSGNKDVQLFVGDTALMIMDCKLNHISRCSQVNEKQFYILIYIIFKDSSSLILDSCAYIHQLPCPIPSDYSLLSVH